VFVTLGIKPAMRLRHIAICGLPGATNFFHIISYAAQFFLKSYGIQNMCFDFICNS